MKAFEVKGGDMIISCSGVTLGRICLLPKDAAKGVINQALLKIDLDERIMLKKYFIKLFRSETFQRLIFAKSLGTAMPNMVGMTELKEIPIPVPSISE
jgi:type I restriction enzyme S subunit